MGDLVRSTPPGRIGPSLPMTPVAPAPEPDPTVAPPDLRRLFTIARRHLWLILVAMLLGAAGAAYLSLTEVPVYSSTAVIRLKDARRELAGGLADGPRDVLGGGAIDPVQSQIEVLTSRAVALSAVDSFPALRLIPRGIPLGHIDQVKIDSVTSIDSIPMEFLERGVVARAPRGQLQAVYGEPIRVDGVQFVVTEKPDVSKGVVYVVEREAAARRLLGRLQVKPRPNTDVIDVVYTDVDRTAVDRTVDQVVQAFQRVSAANAQAQSTRRREFLEAQLRYNDSLLKAARAELAAFRGQHRALSTRAKLAQEQEGLSGIEVRRNELEVDRRIYVNLLEALGDGDAARLAALMSSPGLAENPVISSLYAQLIQYEASRDSITTGRWGSSPNHPDVRRLDTLIASARTRLIGAVKSVVTGLDARIASLDQLRARNAQAFPQLSVSEEEEARLEQEVESIREVVSELRSEYEKARLAEAVEVGQVEIVDHASIPSPQYGLGWFRRLILGLVLGLLAGAALAALLEQINISIRRPEQVHTVLQLPELAVIPRVSTRVGSSLRVRPRSALANGAAMTKFSSGLVAAVDLQSGGAEAYRLLRTNLLFSVDGDPPRTILITSPAPGDGKSTVAANLAVSYAQQGLSTLLIDADLRRGRLHGFFRFGREPGLAQVLEGELSLDDAIRPTPIDSLSLLTTGRLPRNPAELLGEARLDEILQGAAARFRVVVIDTPPVLAAADAAVVARRVDACLLVLRAGRTSEDEARVSLNRLVAVGGRVVGAVLNDPDARIDRDDEYYYQYQGHYGTTVES